MTCKPSMASAGMRALHGFGAPAGGFRDTFSGIGSLACCGKRVTARGKDDEP